MRVKEWYSWHFPELATLVTDNVEYAKVVQMIGMKEQFEGNRLNDLTNLLNGDENLSKQIMAALLTSMGQEISSVDMVLYVCF
jgi:nucleolar protein 56